jgi:hypothetical protein
LAFNTGGLFDCGPSPTKVVALTRLIVRFVGAKPYKRASCGGSKNKGSPEIPART